MPVTNMAQHVKSVTTAALMTLLYSNFQTLWQDTNDHLANQTTHIYFKFLGGKKKFRYRCFIYMLRASLKILHSVIA